MYRPHDGRVEAVGGGRHWGKVSRLRHSLIKERILQQSGYKQIVIE